MPNTKQILNEIDNLIKEAESGKKIPAEVIREIEAISNTLAKNKDSRQAKPLADLVDKMDEFISSSEENSKTLVTEIVKAISKIKIETPVNVEVPEVKIPDIELPEINVEIPEIKVPKVEVKVPEIKIPDIKIPEQKAPIVKMPASMKIDKPTWFSGLINPISKQLTGIKNILSKIDIPFKPGKAISVRLSDGEKFYKALGGGSFGGGSGQTIFANSAGDKKFPLVNEGDILQSELVTNGANVGVNNPLPSDGDSVYAKDVWVEESTSDNFDGIITSLFDNLHTQIVNSNSENPKTLFIHFNRTIVSNTIGLGDSQGGNFSNVKVEIINSGGVASTVVDESAVNTKYTTRTFQLPVTAGFNALRITFHTTDTVSLTNCVILKTRSVVSRGQAVKPDGTVVDLNATTGGNQKFSLEEFDETFNTNPLPTMDMDYLARVKAGLIEGHSLTQKFGRNSLVGTSFSPIALNGVYQTPSTNQTLEILSSNAGDTSAGAGARKILLQGKYFSGGLLLDQEEEVTMNGTTPVTLTKSWARTPRMFVLESGTYATMTSVSALGTITLRDQGGAGVDWLVIDQFATGNSAGQSQCALYTTPNNTRSVLYSPTFSIDSTKVGNIMFFHRPDAEVITAPFSARRVVQQWDGIKAPDGSQFLVPFASFTGAVDMGFMGKVSVGTGSISANFWLLEVQDGF